MTEDSDDSEGNVVEASVTMSAGASMSARATVAFSADNIRERLDNDEYALALILTATRLENIVSRAIRRHYNWSHEKFDNEGYEGYSLGALIQECVEYGALPEYENELNRMRSGEKQVVSLRNNLVHDYGYLDDIEEDEDLQQDVEKAIEEAIDFIEAVEL